MNREERIAITVALWKMGLKAGVEPDDCEDICHELEDKLDVYDTPQEKVDTHP
jgi:ribosome maturation factor RimP